MSASHARASWINTVDGNIDTSGQIINPALYGLDPARTWLTIPGIMRKYGDVSRSVITKAIRTGLLMVERRPNIRPGTFIALDTAERWIRLRRTSDQVPIVDDDGQLRLPDF